MLSLESNKSELAVLLSYYLIENSPIGKPIVVSGGFTEANTVRSSDPTLDIHPLSAMHEEADTRLNLHCVHADMETIVVSGRDTNVLLLSPAHSDNIPSKPLYMKEGTSKTPKCFPIQEIRMCLSQCCIYRNIGMECIEACHCKKHGNTCHNTHDYLE